MKAEFVGHTLQSNNNYCDIILLLVVEVPEKSINTFKRCNILSWYNHKIEFTFVGFYVTTH